MLTVEGRNVIVDGVRHPIPPLPVLTKVKVWAVPEDYRSGGVFIAVTPQGGIEEVPACASPQFIGEAELEPHPDAVLRAAKDELRARINAERDRREMLPFPYLGKLFDADERSVKRILAAVQTAQAALSANAPFEIEWMCADNTTVTLNAQQMIGVPTAMSQHGYALHQHGRALKAQVEAAESLEALASIDPMAGWPT
jgi:alkylhydroperoxidase/carboxymuconolactone decarboxylase family protein YurZ